MATVGWRTAAWSLAIVCAACDSPSTNYAPISVEDTEVDDSLSQPPSYWAARLNSRSAADRREALGALGNFGREATEYGPSIVRLLSDPDEQTGFTAAWALAHIGSGVHPLLIARLNSDRPIERERAVYGVGEMGPAGEVAIERLRELQKDPNARVRDMAGWAISQVYARQMVPDPNLVLLTGVQGDQEERLAAVERLGATVRTSPVAIRALITLMGDSVPAIRDEAIRALSEAGSVALPSLSNALTHRRKQIRRAAMVAISRMHRNP
jgi:HEAT repeat protein